MMLAAAAVTVASLLLIGAAADVPFIPLTSGTRMPAIACGTGGDNNASAATTVGAALAAGFTHIDTAHDYNDQAGVGRAIAGRARPQIFLTSKVPGCGVPTQGLMPPCRENTAKLVDEDLALLATPYVDLMLIHFPPLGGCIKANCAHMQQQWAALEEAYAAKKARAIGVSNYCKDCLKCVLQTAKVVPMVNQVQYHVGMGPEIPGGLLEFCVLHGIAVMAYSPLGGGHVLASGSPFAPVGARLAAKHNVSAAQVALAYVGQRRFEYGVEHVPIGLVTKSSNPAYLKEDLALWSAFNLTAADRQELDGLAAPACKAEAPGGCCTNTTET